MGEHGVKGAGESEELRAFSRALLEDVRALERMIAEGRIEAGVRRIGAEQELFLVDEAWRPAPRAGEILERLVDEPFTPELARFNLEANLSPMMFEGGCLGEMEAELERLLSLAHKAADSLGIRLLMCGILPTLHQSDLTLDNMSPSPRYASLNRVMTELRGGEFRTLIKGLDELQISHDNVMLEACNTSFQVHFQTSAEEFAQLYNQAQMVTAPVLAAAVNSPVLLQHRLWHETRVALFQQSLDSRSEALQKRGKRQRVYFGDQWIDSVLDIFREDIARFRVLLAADLGESSMDVLDRGETPLLPALCLHNGTVYRWNRPCYGVKDGLAHLRIENRVLPAGPTARDEVANSAFYFGLMAAVGEEYGDVRTTMPFDDVKANFMAAARYGLSAQLHWAGGESYSASDLILDRLLPLARSGLTHQKIEPSDIDRYLGIVEDRVRSKRTGAQWALDSLASMEGRGTADEQHLAITSAMADRQLTGRPVHTWPLAKLGDSSDWRHSFKTVRQVMQTDPFTLHPEDVIDLAASLMDWERVRHVPVEDQEGKLVGLLSQRALLRLVANNAGRDAARPVAVREVMRPDPITIEPSTSTLDAIARMREHKVGCLPVVEGDRLVGLVTEADFIHVASKLLEESLSAREERGR